MTDRLRPAVELGRWSRAINAEPWEPVPGLVKRQCPQCRYFFATPTATPAAVCPDCASKGPRGPVPPACA